MIVDYYKLKSKYPDKVPLIVDCPLLKKKKYLVPLDMTISCLICYFRKKMVLKPTEAVYVLIKYDDCSVIPKHSDLISMYEKSNVICMSIKMENTFGGEDNDFTIAFLITILIVNFYLWFFNQ